MVRFIGSVIVPYSRDRVFTLMSDWTNLKIWDINIIKSDLSPNQSQTSGKGTRYDCAFKVGNRAPIDVAYECVSFTDNTEARFLGLATLFRSEDAVSVADVPGQPGHTNLTAEFNLSFRGLLSPLSFVMQGQMDKTGPIVMKDIETFVTDNLGHAGDGAPENKDVDT